MANHKAIAYHRQGIALVIHAPSGDVDLARTASVWGEGPNVPGFQWARPGQKPLTEAQGICLFGPEAWKGEKQLAEEWAYMARLAQ